MTIAPDVVAEALAGADRMLNVLRGDIGTVRDRVGQERRRGSQLVALDLSRTLVALGAADLALQRARRHADLEVAR